MKTLILYETVHGSAEKCALLLKEKINRKSTVVRLQENENIDISGFDMIILGGSIHNGVIHTRVQEFIEKNFPVLLQKPHGLFLVCMETGETAVQEFNNAFPEKLRKSAIASGIFGGELIFKKMNTFERFVTSKIAKVTKSVSRINFEEIDKFAEAVTRHDLKLFRESRTL